MLVKVHAVCVGIVSAAAMLVACGGAPGSDPNEKNDETIGAAGAALATRGAAGDTATITATTSTAAMSTTPVKTTTPSTSPTSATVGTSGLGSLTATNPFPVFTIEPCARFSTWLVQVPRGTACTNVSTGADGSYIGQSGAAWIADLAEYWARMVAPANTQPDVTNPAFLAWAESTIVSPGSPFDPLAPGASFCEYWWRSATDQNDATDQMGYASSASEHTAAKAHESILVDHVGSRIEEACMAPGVEEVMDNGCVTHGNHPSCMGCAMVW